MSNVVIMNLLGAHYAGTCWKAFSCIYESGCCPPTAIFVFGWGGGDIARIPPVPAAGGRSTMASGAYHSPSRELTSLKWHGLAKSKI
jgi:hypothetical protein